jgi:DNA-directed RNA polymerase alpha subunit
MAITKELRQALATLGEPAQLLLAELIKAIEVDTTAALQKKIRDRAIQAGRWEATATLKLDARLHQLELSEEIDRRLRHAKIYTIGELVCVTDKELLGIGFTAAAIGEVSRRLAAIGYKRTDLG